MIKNPSYGSEVKMAKEKASAFNAKGNSKSVANVNQPQGPRNGNSSARPGKRAEFVAEKVSRDNLADTITAAYAARGQGRADSVNKSLENISPDTKVKFKR